MVTYVYVRKYSLGRILAGVECLEVDHLVEPSDPVGWELVHSAYITASTSVVRKVIMTICFNHGQERGGGGSRVGEGGRVCVKDLAWYPLSSEFIQAIKILYTVHVH